VYLKSGTGEILIEKEERIIRWTEFLRDLYNDDRENNDTSFNEDGPSILREEIESAIKQTNKGKTPGPDNIVIE
jgi:hypothetical protein